MASIALDPRPSIAAPRRTSPRWFVWAVFALTFGLLLSDYMSRQVVSAIFPALKAEWALSDTRLAALNSVVSLSVALLAIPLSVVGDRLGRARAVAAMALIWSLATLASGLAASYGQLLAARVIVGVGEAAYGSIGLAVLLTVFSARSRSTLTAAFLAGGSFGSVLGVVVGGAIADAFGWRAAFFVLGIAGIVLTGLYTVTITDRRLQEHAHPEQQVVSAAESVEARRRFLTLVSTPSVIAAYLASGLHLLVLGALFAWLPSFFVRDYAVSATTAGSLAGLVVLVVGLGMITTGAITDRLSRTVPARKWEAPMVFSFIAMVALLLAFRLPSGPLQVGVLCVGAFFCAGLSGPAGALVANLTPSSIHATAFATLSLANNLLGLAAGPLLVGLLADRMGLSAALGLIPLVSIAVIGLLVWGRARFQASLDKVGAPAQVEAR